jgi:hypothetical protein
MSHFLAYLQHYWEDLKHPAKVIPGWGTKSDYVHRMVKPGDVIWVVTRGGPGHEDEWRLLQKVVVARNWYDTERKDNFRYRVAEDEAFSAVYDPTDQGDLTPLLHKLDFASGKRIMASGGKIGQSLQTVRPVTSHSGTLLEAYAAKLRPFG